MAKMAILEKLFVQIFDRKSWIIDQVDQQSRLFDQNLASKLLIDGITPPPWLLNSDSRSRTSELNAEELISGVLLSRPPPLNPFSYSQRAVYEETVAETTSRGQPNALCPEMCAQNEGFDGREMASALKRNLGNATGLVSAGVSTMDHCITSLEGQREEDISITSPQDQRDHAILDVNHDLALSLSRLQRSRSRQKALEIRRSAKKPNRDESNPSGGSSRVYGSAVLSFQNYQLEELNTANPLDAQNEPSALEGAKSSGAQSKEKISSISKDYVLTSTVVPSLQQSSSENPPLELLSGSQFAETEVRIGGKRKEVIWNNMDNRRVTRSRNMSYGASSIESSQEALHSNAIEPIITESISTTSHRSRSSKGSLKVTGNSIDFKRTLRSRSKVTQDVSMIEPVQDALHSEENQNLITGSLFTTSNRSRSSKGTQVKDQRSSSIREDEEPCAANSTDSSDNETVAEDYVGKYRRAKPISTIEVTSNIFNSQDLGRRVTRSTSAVLHKPLGNNSYSLDATGSEELSHAGVKDLPCIDLKEPASIEGRISTGKEVEVDLGIAVEARSVNFGSKLNNASAANLEELATCPAKSPMPMEPKQLNFDEAEPLNLDDISTSVFGNEVVKFLEEKEPSELLEVTGVVDKEMPESCPENDSSQLEDRDYVSTEEECKMGISEFKGEEFNAATVALNEHGESLEKEAPFLEDMVTHTLQQQSKKCDKEKSSLTGNLVALQAERVSLTRSDPSDLDTCTAMNIDYMRTESKSLLGLHVDTDHSLVTRPEIDPSGAGSKDEIPLNVDQEIKDLNASHCCAAEFMERPTHDDTTEECFHSSQSSRLQPKEVGFSLEERNLTENTPFTFAYEELETSLGSSVVRNAVRVCQLNMMGEEARDTDPSSIITDGNWQRSFDNGSSFLLNDDFVLGINESLTGTEASVQENKSESAETRKFSFDADHTMPMLEGFVLQSDDEQQCIVDDEISIDSLNLPKTTVERASLLEKLCKSACMQTPVTYSIGSYHPNKALDVYQSVPTGLLEGVDVKNKRPIREEYSFASQGRSHSDSSQNPTTGRDWEMKKPCLSPVQKAWERILSKSASSEKRKSLNHELPSINEESESIEEVADILQGRDSGLMDFSVKREPLAGIDENRVSEIEPYLEDRFSLNSMATEFSFNGSHDRIKTNLENEKSVTRRYNIDNKENEDPSRGSHNKNLRPLYNRSSKQKMSASIISSKGGSGSTKMEPRRNNIVSNISSFIPFVQQKQASTITTGKRDVKVKALEAAEAARRLAEKKENERKTKKEAMKLERARAEQKNLKQLELQRKIKEEERRKKEADMVAKKRQREEEEKKERERKRLRVDETRKQQKENEQKLQAAKEDKNRTRIMEMREGKLNNSKIEKVKMDENVRRYLEAEPTTTRASTSDDRRAAVINEEFEASSDFVNNFKANDSNKLTATQSLVSSQEPSYDISPYKCTDDEDDEDDDDDDDDDIGNNRPRKFVPSWASKRGLVSVIFAQDSQSPWEIFQQGSFCSISKVAQPRKLNIKQ